MILTAGNWSPQPLKRWSLLKNVKTYRRVKQPIKSKMARLAHMYPQNAQYHPRLNSYLIALQ